MLAVLDGTPGLAFSGVEIEKMQYLMECGDWNSPKYLDIVNSLFRGPLPIACGIDLIQYRPHLQTDYFNHRVARNQLAFLAIAFDGIELLEITGAADLRGFKSIVQSIDASHPALCMPPSIEACIKYNADCLQKKLMEEVRYANQFMDDLEEIQDLVRDARNMMTGPMDAAGVHLFRNIRDAVRAQVDELHDDILGDASDLLV